MPPAFLLLAFWHRIRRLWTTAATGGMLLFLLALAGPARAATEPLLLDDSKGLIDAWPAVEVLFDPTHALKLPDLIDRADLFSRPPSPHATLGVRPETVWLRLPVRVPGDANGRWVLQVDYAVLNQIDLYVVREGQVVSRALLGNAQKFSNRPLVSRSHAASVELQPGRRYELLMRVDTRGAMILPIAFVKPALFHERALNEQMLQGLLTGLALCLLVYSLAQWLTLREALFAKYALLISGSLLFSLLQFGIGAQYVWTNNLWIEHHMSGLSALIAMCGSFLFIEQALVGSRPRPVFTRLMKGGAAVTAAIGVAHALDWLDIGFVTRYVTVFGMVPALMGIPGALARARRGDAVGWYFLVGWSVYLVSTGVIIGVIRGVLPVNFWTLHSFQFGATLDMLIFMRVLGLRTHAVHLAARHAAMERDAMRWLAHTDALTGLPNRRGLNDALQAELVHSAPERLLAVYMLDLDGFKPVNDQFGHDVGDELLVLVSRRLQSLMRASDVVARLGGDEFVVMTTGLQTDRQAHELGQKLLAGFETPFELAGRPCRVGLTIGYALAPLDADDPVTLLKTADLAMYRGKQAGKHCLRRAAPAGA